MAAQSPTTHYDHVLMPILKPSSGPPAWTRADLADPHANLGKPEKVRAMFAAIARRYDLNNRVHSMWRDQAWRRFAVRQADVRGPEEVLDVACGTGDLSFAFVHAGAARVVGLDFTREMLDIGEVKRERLVESEGARVSFVQGDAHALPFEEASFDVVSIAFGIRNVADPRRALAEFWRVLRPGGRLVILEFATPRLWPVRLFNDFYCRRIMPVTATLISGDRSGAYKYLPKSVETFMTPAELCRALEEAGFGAVTMRSLSLGICMCYRAEVKGRTRPKERARG